jgi:hypothetical protein
MRKSFRVATVFTGVAACATALGPAAEAAPAAPAGRITGSIVGKNCTSSLGNWVHLYYSQKEKHPTPACFGNNGWYSLNPAKRFYYICAGNNSGEIIESGGRYIESFGPKVAGGAGEGFSLFSAKVSSIRITKHTNQYSKVCDM